MRPHPTIANRISLTHSQISLFRKDSTQREHVLMCYGLWVAMEGVPAIPDCTDELAQTALMSLPRLH
jgi:hypothetical protein